MWKDFREFAFKGNVIDLAVALIIGLAFTAIVTSLVKDILSPFLGWLLGGVDLTSLYINLSGQSYPSLAAAQEAGAPVITYGNFLNAIVTFFLIALSLFLVVKAINRVRAPQAVDTRDCPFCLSTVPLNATRCPQCTSELTPSTTGI
jgi:large conductance mechanosensitive channel